jgi:hypothetical protein
VEARGGEKAGRRGSVSAGEREGGKEAGPCTHREAALRDDARERAAEAEHVVWSGKKNDLGPSAEHEEREGSFALFASLFNLLHACGLGQILRLSSTPKPRL